MMRKATWLLLSTVVVIGAVIVSLLIAAPRDRSGPPLEQQASLDLVAEGLVHPVGAVVAPGLGDRVFIVDQIGTVRTLMANGTLLEDPFLDLREEMVPLNSGYDERGLLSIVFHPQYRDNHKLFAFYSAPLRPEAPGGYDHTNIIAELTASNDSSSVDTASLRIILAIDNPYANHNGGQVLFGPDGLLYVTVGDGGGGNDQGRGHNASIGNAQDLNSIHGKVLRLDVDRPNGSDPYSIPPDNPFADRGGLPEIYAWGLRNPAYATFVGERLFVADAGQSSYEEVDIVVKGGNYGWNIREGYSCFDPNNSLYAPPSCPSTGADGEPLTDPIGGFINSAQPGGEGAAIVGGTPYTGNISALQGGYVFGAYRSGSSPLFVLLPSDEHNWTRHTVPIDGFPGGRVPGYLLAVTSGLGNDILVLTADAAGPGGTSGKVWRLVLS